MQVLKLDSFVSKEDLLKRSNEATADYIEGLILTKIKNKFQNMNRTDIQVHHGLITSKILMLRLIYFARIDY
jgi:hypothetical protein